MSGNFGLELTDAMQAMQNSMDASHPLLSKEVDNISLDLDRDPDDELDPMKLLREASCFARSTFNNVGARLQQTHSMCSNRAAWVL